MCDLGRCDSRMVRFERSALGRNRTCGQKIRSLLLYPLSYEGSGQKPRIYKCTAGLALTNRHSDAAGREARFHAVLCSFAQRLLFTDRANRFYARAGHHWPGNSRLARSS